MKRFAAVTLSVLMLLTVFASAASAADAVEIRGPVFNGSDINNIIDTQGDGNAIIIDATEFAAFYYDINDNVTTETLSIKDVEGTQGNVIGKNGLVYETTIQPVKYQYENAAAGWDNYSLIGFFADKYIPLKSTDASKLAKLVLDSDDKYTIRTGETLDLGSGYTLEAKQVDVDGKKVWLQFNKDGQFVDDEIVSVEGNNGGTWTVEKDDILGEDNVPVFKVHVNQVFQGAVDSIAQIEGLWLIDYANAIEIKSDDEFGKLNNVNINGATLSITNDDTFTLTRDSTQEIYNGLGFKVADTPTNVLRFYPVKEITEPGTYQIRGTVVNGPGDFTWDATNFAGFFYDLNDNVATESLSVAGISGNVIPDSGLTYKTTIKNIDYKYTNTAEGWTQYPVLGFFADKYIPIKSGDASKLAKLVLDSDDKYTVRTGESLDLGQGYTLEAKQVDVDGKKVWLQFNKDGQFIDDEIVSVEGNNGGTWTVEKDDVLGEDNVQVLKVHVNQVFQGAVDSIAQIEGLWLIDYANAIEIKSDDEFGKLNNVNIDGATLSITNDDTFTLTRDSDQEIGGLDNNTMYFKVADTPVNELRYYPYVEKTVGEGNQTNESTAPSVGNQTETPVVGNQTGNISETPSEGNLTETPTEVNATTGETTGETNNTTTGGEKPSTPGFGALLGVVGLIAVVYLVRRND